MSKQKVLLKQKKLNGKSSTIQVIDSETKTVLKNAKSLTAVAEYILRNNLEIEEEG